MDFAAMLHDSLFVYKGPYVKRLLLRWKRLFDGEYRLPALKRLFQR